MIGKVVKIAQRFPYFPQLISPKIFGRALKERKGLRGPDGIVQAKALRPRTHLLQHFGGDRIQHFKEVQNDIN